MSRILLADDSAHAQRIGELILREEGYEVVSVTDGETAVVRLADVDPDLILADALLPLRNGYEICQYVKNHPSYRHARVVLTAGALEPLDEEEASRVQADATIRKPFEASVLLEIVKPLVEASVRDREASHSAALEKAPPAEAPSEDLNQGAEVEEILPESPAPSTPAEEILPQAAPVDSGHDPESIRAAVILALNEAFPLIADEVAARVEKYLTQCREPAHTEAAVTSSDENSDP